MSFVATPRPGVSEKQTLLGGVGTGPQVFLLVAIAIIVVITAVRTWIWWRTDAGITFASGVMITMATDLKEGVFYRPLYDSQGYGGTRYFPLYFSLHALLLKLGMPLLAGAYLLSALAILLLMAGVFRLLRELGVEAWLAACAAGALLAAGSVQLSLSTPQADGLAAALNVWGLAAIVRTPHSSRRVLLASLLFTLAWSAKLTTVFGLIAAVIWLMAAGFKRVAGLLVAETACGYLLVAGIMTFASRGRVVEIFKACASGGADWRFIVSGPARMESMAAYTDPGLVMFAVFALTALAWMTFSSKLWLNLPALLLITTLATTMLIFGSPGTAANHLLDVQVASVVLLVTWVGHENTPLQKRIGVYLIALLVLVAAVPLLHHIRAWNAWYHPHQFQRIIEFIGPADGPILAENPVIPALAGQHPYVLDPWMVQLLEQRRAGFAGPLLERLHDRAFAAVVLSADPAQESVRRWYDTVSFGPGFALALVENYKLATVIDKDWIFVPVSETTRNEKHE
jgi:hypothetical protein